MSILDNPHLSEISEGNELPKLQDAVHADTKPDNVLKRNEKIKAKRQLS